MRATIMYRAGDVRVENVPDAKLVSPTDARVRITRACICAATLGPAKTYNRAMDERKAIKVMVKP